MTTHIAETTMLSSDPVTETIPTTWTESRDVPFFRIATALFPTHVVYGAGVLLATYDRQPAPAVAAV